jgi:hypothetical protein
LTLDDGKAVYEANVPGRVSYRPEALIGYWFKDGDVEVEPGTEPLRVEIPAMPAGAIVGELLEPDGTPAVEGVSLGCHVVEKPPALGQGSIDLNNFRVEAYGHFLLSPLPLGAPTSWSRAGATTGRSAPRCGSTAGRRPSGSCSGWRGPSSPRGA